MLNDYFESLIPKSRPNIVITLNVNVLNPPFSLLKPVFTQHRN